MSGYRRAVNLKKPKNQKAMKAANGKVPIANTPELKKKWMDAYIDAGGQYKDVKPKGCKPGDTRAKCRTKPISQIKITSIKFLTDHNLLKNNSTNWNDGGSRYPEPEWTPAHQYPVSHSMGEHVKLEIKFEVLPADARNEVGILRGSGRIGSNILIFEESGYKFSPGNHIRVLTSKQKLKKKVGSHKLRITWDTNVGSGSVTPGQTENQVYVTYGRPYGSSVTEKRIAQVTKAAKGKTTELKCVDAIFDDMMRFNYHLGSPYPSPVWLVYGGVVRGECHALADLFELSCKMLGLPDNFIRGYIYPKQGGGGGKFSTSDDANESRLVASTHPHPPTLHGYKENLSFRDHSTRSTAYEGWNNFEGSVKYNGTYYCIGEGRFPSPSVTMNKMVVATIWVSDMVGICKNPGPCPEHTWNPTRWNAILRPC